MRLHRARNVKNTFLIRTREGNQLGGETEDFDEACALAQQFADESGESFFLMEWTAYYGRAGPDLEVKPNAKATGGEP